MTTQNGRAFNEWLRAQLKAKKMSQRQLAQQSGVDHSTISRLIRGDRMPSLGTATKLARGLRELRDDADTPQYLGLVAAGNTNPTARVEYALRADELLSRAAGSPDHGVLPGRTDAPLWPHLPASRTQVRHRADLRSGPPGGLPPRQARSGPGSGWDRPSASSAPFRAPPTGSQGATRAYFGADPASSSTIRVSGQRTSASGAPTFAIPGPDGLGSRRPLRLLGRGRSSSGFPASRPPRLPAAGHLGSWAQPFVKRASGLGYAPQAYAQANDGHNAPLQA